MEFASHRKADLSQTLESLVRSWQANYRPSRLDALLRSVYARFHRSYAGLIRLSSWSRASGWSCVSEPRCSDSVTLPFPAWWLLANSLSMTVGEVRQPRCRQILLRTKGDISSRAAPKYAGLLSPTELHHQPHRTSYLCAFGVRGEKRLRLAGNAWAVLARRALRDSHDSLWRRRRSRRPRAQCMLTPCSTRHYYSRSRDR